jgi:L-threonylcarbamoyladenylate synthase
MLVVESTLRGIRKASRIVKNGGVCIFPTDTLYALGCDPRNEHAVDRIYEIKHREKRPVPILCDSKATAVKTATLNTMALSLADRFWPGPLTLVAPCTEESIVKALIAEDGTIGVRVPNLGSCLLLARLTGGLLVGTSANISGRPAPYSLEDVAQELRGSVDIAINGGDTIFRSASTVVKSTQDSVKIIREGAIKRSEIIRASRWYM